MFKYTFKIVVKYLTIVGFLTQYNNKKQKNHEHNYL